MGISTAQKVVDIALSYVGCKTGSAKHKELVKAFNSVRPHGEKAANSSPWCAIAWTAWQILAGNTIKQVPMSYNCGQLIKDAKNLGIWIEKDSTKPKIGWGILYDWDDSGKGDNTGAAENVGLVYAVDSKYIYVVEGNKGTAETCGKRAIQINGRFIRGFIAPKFNDKYEPAQTSAEYRKPSKTGKYWAKVVTQHDPLNVRQGPGTEYGLCTTFGPIPKGSTVMVCDELTANDGSTWCYIFWSGKYGFCSKKYLKESGVF